MNSINYILAFEVAVGIFLLYAIYRTFFPEGISSSNYFKKFTKKGRSEFILGYSFPQRLRARLKLTYPHLTDDDVLLAESALRNYFVINSIAGKTSVAMPSQAVDIMWHEFILFTKQYQGFCKRSFGRFLHHTPNEAMAKSSHAQIGIKNAWYFACRSENITPKYADRLPLLFALDSDLNIPDGFHYHLNCRLSAISRSSSSSKSNNGGDYCAGDIGCSSESGCFSDSDSDSSSSGSSCSSGDNGSSGGSSCGSSCGGD